MLFFPIMYRDREATLAIFEIIKNQPGYHDYSRFDLECNTNLCNNYERLHQWWCQGERTSSIFLMR
jgi:hypothetical protein